MRTVIVIMFAAVLTVATASAQLGPQGGPTNKDTTPPRIGDSFNAQ